MSGPKVLTISREELERRAEMERQRIWQEERLRIVQDQVRIAETIHRQICLLKNVQGKAALVINHKDIPVVISHTQEVISNLEKKTGEWSIVSQKKQNAELQQYIEELRILAGKTEREIQECDTRISDVRKEYIEELLKAETVNQSVKTNTGMLIVSEEKRLRELIQSIQYRCKRIEVYHTEQLASIENEIPSIENEIQEILAETSDDMTKYEKLHRLELARILVALRNVAKEEKAFDKLDQELSKEIAVYNATCAMYGMPAKKFAFSDASIIEIRNELAAVACMGNNPVYDQTENMEKLRGILSDLGYSYIGQKEEKRGVIRHLYRVHDNVVIHVVYDTSGRVTMEVAIEDVADREPMNSEISQLVDEQIEFCRGFGSILERMQSEDIPLQKDMFFPPDPEFSKVINSSSFEKEEERYEDYSQYEYENKYLEAKP